jgi:hypothetical protein
VYQGLKGNIFWKEAMEPMGEWVLDSRDGEAFITRLRQALTDL